MQKGTECKRKKADISRRKAGVEKKEGRYKKKEGRRKKKDNKDEGIGVTNNNKEIRCTVTGRRRKKYEGK
jgi:hypothetical protein